MKRAIGIAFALLLPLVVRAQSSGWAAPQHVASPMPSNWFPSVAVDPWGKVHVVWSTGKEQGKDSKSLLMYSRLEHGRWLPANDVIWAGSADYAARNGLAVDRAGRLHALVRSRDEISYTSAPGADAWSAQAWSTPHEIAGIGQAYYEAIAVDASGTIHVVWQDAIGAVTDQGCADCANVWYRRSTDGQVWSPPINLSHGPNGAGKLQIVVAPAQQLYVVWSEGSDPFQGKGTPVGVALAHSADNGQSWDPPQRIVVRDDGVQQAALGVDRSDTLVLVFRSTATNALLYTRSNDHGWNWSPPAPLPGLIARSWDDTPWDTYSIAADSAGNLHLLAAARRDEAQTIPALYHVVWRGDEQRWEPPEVVMQNELRPEWPQAVVAAGNQLHVVWYTKSAQDMLTPEKPNYQVWYSTRTLQAPAVPVTPLPAATPSPTAMPLPTATAAPLPTLPDSAIQAPPASSLRSELPLLRQVGLALVPTLGLALLIWSLSLARQRRRRSTRAR